MVDRGGVDVVKTSEKGSNAERLAGGTVDTQALLAHQALSEADTDEDLTNLGESYPEHAPLLSLLDFSRPFSCQLPPATVQME